MATLSPAVHSIDETISTLRFAQRVKKIRNVATINAESNGSVTALQREIESLKQQLYYLSQNPSSTVSAMPFNVQGGAYNRSLGEEPAVTDDMTELDVKYDQLCARLDTLLDRRSTVAIEQLQAVEQNNISLAARLELAERVSMGLKMKVKMRDSELQRIKKSLVPTPASTADVTSTTEGAAPTPLLYTEEQLQAEVAATRDETKADLLKYKLAYDEIIRRATSSPTMTESTSTGLSVEEVTKNPALVLQRFVHSIWTQSDEAAFTETLSSQLMHISQEYVDLNVKIEQLRDQKCQELFGFTFEEGLAMRERVTELDRLNLSLTTERDEMIELRQIKSKQFESSLMQLEYDVHERVKGLNGSLEAKDAEIARLGAANVVLVEEKCALTLTVAEKDTELAAVTQDKAAVTEELMVNRLKVRCLLLPYLYVCYTYYTLYTYSLGS